MIKKLPLQLFLTGLVFFISLSTISAQVSLREISLKEQINNSSLVVEGQVIDQRSFWGANDKIIYTAYTVEVYKVFKGVPVSQVEVVTIGGTVGLNALLVSHGLKLGKSSKGIFTLYDSKFNVGSKNQTKNKQFKTYSGIQGFYAYDLNADVAKNPFSKRKGIASSLYKDILKITKRSYETVASFDIEAIQKKPIQYNNSRPPSGITFSPTSISAGTGSVLTIEGSGFGTTQGKVGFRNSNDGGGSFFDAQDSQVLSWDDEIITVEVPDISTLDESIAGTAGTGNIRVTDSGGNSSISSASLTILFAEQNVPFDLGTGAGVELFSTQHYGENASGGYTWKMFTDFFNESKLGIPNTGYKAAFLRAFDTWRCETKVNWDLDANPTIVDQIDTADHIIRFDNGSELPAGTLGTCFTRLSGRGCGGGLIVFVTDLDIIFDSGVSWYFGASDSEGNYDPGEYSFETVALHELGHGHQLGHVVDPSNVMHYFLDSQVNNPDPILTLDENSLTGANNVHARSTSNQICDLLPSNPRPLMTDYTGSCGLNVQDNTLESSISIFPNPTKQQFFIKSTVVNLDKVDVYDVSGRLISQIDTTDSPRTISINLLGASIGVYFVNIHSEGRVVTEKLIIK